jgi:hypothetical protein
MFTRLSLLVFIITMAFVGYASSTIPVSYVYNMDEILEIAKEANVDNDNLHKETVNVDTLVVQLPDFELIVNRDSLRLLLHKIGPAYSKIDSLQSDSVHIFENMLLATIQHPYFLDWIFTRNGTMLQSDIEKRAIIDKIKSGKPIVVIKQPHEIYLYDLQDQTKVKKNASLSFQEYVLINQNITPRNRTVSKQHVAPVYWSNGAQMGLHVSQHYVSPNWYRGGESHLAVIAFANGFYNYNNKKTIQWENKVDFKAGFNSSTADTVRFLQTNDDVLRLSSKFGYKAFTKFFYTGQAEITTQLFNTYKINSYERITAALSPVRLSLSAGLDYKMNGDLSAFFSPVSYKYLYVNDTTTHISVNKTIADRLGIPKGEKSLHEVGSLVRVNYKYKISNEIQLDTRTTLYTNYKGVEFDSEIIGNFKINRFLTTRLSVNPRYDSTFKLPNNEKAKLQFRQILSLGFTYKLN